MYKLEEGNCIKKLIVEYTETLGEIKERLRKLEREISPYKEIYLDKKIPEKVRHKAREAAAPLLYKKSIVVSWKSNLEYSISWMETGRRPGSVRGVERRAAYERERSFDPLLMQSYFRSEEVVYSWDDKGRESAITQSDRERINNALSVLTDREKEIYLMAKGHCISFGRIAKQLDISKATVSTTFYRADRKIGKYLANLKGCEEG